MKPSLFLFFYLPLCLLAQQGINTNVHPSNKVSNGSGTLGNTFNMRKCGLDYVQVTQRLGTRFSPAGAAQPVGLNVTGLPCTSAGGITKEAAYIWWSVSTNTNPATMNVTITNPSMVTSVFTGTQIGTGTNTCWGFTSTTSYRATIPIAFVTGNGNYTISGLPTSTSSGGVQDTDGATLMIIYSDPSQNYVGSLTIDDGANIQIGTSSTYNVTLSPSVCKASIAGRAFLMGSDFQDATNTFSLNGGAYTAYLGNSTWWDFIQIATNYTAGQVSSSFGVNIPGGDCYNWVAAGSYYRVTPGGTCPTCAVVPLCALPTQEHHFEVQPYTQQKDALLTWETQLTSEVKQQVIERSINGNTFQEIHTLPALTRTYIDKEPAYNVPVQYRIRIEDKDGKTYYTETKELTLVNTEKAFLGIYPNPITHQQNLNLTYFTYQPEQLNIEMVDILGKVVYSQKRSVTAGTNTLEIPTHAFQTGIYMLKVSNLKNTYIQKINIIE